MRPALLHGQCAFYTNSHIQLSTFGLWCSFLCCGGSLWKSSGLYVSRSHLTGTSRVLPFACCSGMLDAYSSLFLPIFHFCPLSRARDFHLFGSGGTLVNSSANSVVFTRSTNFKQLQTTLPSSQNMGASVQTALSRDRFHSYITESLLTFLQLWFLIRFWHRASATFIHVRTPSCCRWRV